MVALNCWYARAQAKFAYNLQPDRLVKEIKKATSWPQTSRSGYLTTASTFLALFLMKNKVKTTMRTGEPL